MKVLRRKVASWRRWPAQERRWFLPAFLLLGLARLALLVLPFRKIAPKLGHEMKTGAVVPLASGEQMTKALNIGRAVRVAARYTPWESKCLAQAMAARALLGYERLPYALFLGVVRSEKAGLEAHAWVCSGRAAVVGGRSFEGFTVVGTYVSPRLEPSPPRVPSA